jgi:hypothetical protein
VGGGYSRRSISVKRDLLYRVKETYHLVQHESQQAAVVDFLRTCSLNRMSSLNRMCWLHEATGGGGVDFLRTCSLNRGHTLNRMCSLNRGGRLPI